MVCLMRTTSLFTNRVSRVRYKEVILYKWRSHIDRIGAQRTENKQNGAVGGQRGRRNALYRCRVSGIDNTVAHSKLC